MASSYWTNVLDYGATGNGSTDDTTAVQSALNAVPPTGGTVVFPAGTYKISSPLVARSSTVLAGVSDGASVISQSSSAHHALTGTDITRLTIEDLTFQGPGSGTGKGIVLSRVANPATVSLAFSRVTVKFFGDTGIDLSNPIVSTFTGVTSANNGNHGWNIHGVPGHAAGTSCSFLSCYADTVTNAGFRIDTMAYCSFVGCAADHCGIGYEVTGTGSQGIAFSGCGAESAVDRGTGYDGYGYTNITNDTAGGSVATGFVYGAGSALYEGTVSGGTVPTQDQHLTRKDYVDAKLDPAPVALTDAPAIATDAALGSHFRVTLGGNRTLGTPAHPTDGQRAVWELVQDATGNRTLTLGPGLGSTISSVTLSTGANRRDFLTAVHNAEKNKWYVVDFVKGY
ncbi:glycosyl hydrolase family 28-related protein [Streptomyces sp. NPDC052040]|uniref:glycosyl hydrolase family 28-related protein n=1 Tax=Streptomyces sp. NPDC052040 TaxID=3365682 RepID=UPI0037CD60DF